LPAERAGIDAMRKELGEALVECGKDNRSVVVLDADASNSTMTVMFQAAFPNRFFNVGIAEAGMIDTAVGLALAGKIPFVSAFAAMLCYRGLEAIRTCVAYNGANVKLLSGFAGVSDYKDGPTHHSLVDLAIMRALPNMTVVVAADGQELKKLVPAVAEHPGPVYLRISRADIPYSRGTDGPIVIGKGRILRDGTDVTLLACGTMLHRCLEAQSLLEKAGVSARLVELHTLKPLDEELVLRCADQTGALVTVEEHSIIGGLYGSVAELLVRTRMVPVEAVGLQDAFSRTAPSPEALWDFCGLTADNIVRAAKKVLERK
jgi:transketolase